MPPSYTPAQYAALDAHIGALVQALPSRPWRPADEGKPVVVCNRAVCRRGTYEQCGSALVTWRSGLRARCEEHQS